MSRRYHRRPAGGEDPLVQGLRALSVLALRGPLDLAGVARSNGLSVQKAAALIDIFIATGLVERLSDGTSLAVTALGRALIGSRRRSRLDLH